MENFILIAVFLLLGMLFRRVKAFPKESAQVLNIFVVYVSLPALVLVKVPQMAISREVVVAVVLPWIMLAFSAALVFAAARLRGWDRRVTGVLLLIVPLGNTSFVGVPMVRAFFGEAGVPYALVYDQFGSFIALSTYGSVILSLYGREGRVKIGAIARRVLLFPPFIALAIALASRPWPWPAGVVRALSEVAATLTPLVMTAVGFQLRLRLKAGFLEPFGFGLAVKLLAAPLVAIALCRLAGIGGIAAEVSMLEAGMPPMVTAAALAVMAGMNAELSAALVGFGIFFSFATLPLVYFLIGL